LSRSIDLSGASTAGFTLVEALAALAVLGAGLAAVGAVTHVSASAATNAERRFALVEAASSLFETALLGGANGAARGVSGAYAWSEDVEVYPFSAGPDGGASRWRLQQVTITLRAPTGEVLSVETVRLAPGAPP